MNPYEARVNFGWPGHDVIRLYTNGKIEVDGEETQNPWVIGKAFQKFATQFVEMQENGNNFEQF
jgi:hypothetical protein|tara:strand:+ start:288 stop:479 length:192 start_codon:yes stop_codon:yes gene_type:complete